LGGEDPPATFFYGVTDGVGVGVAVPGGEGRGEIEDNGEAEGEADGEGDGLARMSSHDQSSPVYPPISLKRVEQRSCNFGKSGGPGDSSAEPGKTI
jgi:hypothetical protein